jgi:biotin carboxylase
MSEKSSKYILIVEFVPELALENYAEFVKNENKVNNYLTKLVLLHDRSNISAANQAKLHYFDYVHRVNFFNPGELQQVLLPYDRKILGVICRSESYIPKLAELVAQIPYVKLPTKESLLWSVNKLQMRRRFRRHNSKITPKFREVKNVSEDELDKIEKTVPYPMVVKPYGLAQSLLVTNVYHREELKKTLERSFKKLSQIHRENDKVGPEGLLVEELMEGSQYSIDCFVNSKGKSYFCPPVHIKTGKQIGFDDYFGYRQMTPTKLKKTTVEKMEAVAAKAVHALGLRSTTVHAELIRTELGWKIIEVAPRVGGFRDDLYKLSYGFDYGLNDLRIRMGRKPIIQRKVKGYTAAMKLYAKSEGKITSVKGIQKMKTLESFVKFLSKPARSGDKAKFAKHGGRSIAKVLLHNSDRSKLLADIRRLEQMFEVKVA